MPKCDNCGSYFEDATMVQCPICHHIVVEKQLFQLICYDALLKLQNHPFTKAQAILCEKLDEMLYIPFKDLLGDDPHRFGIQKERYKQLIEKTFVALETTLKVQFKDALNECCHARCRFCYQDEKWKFGILGMNCLIAKIRKEWEIEDPE